MTTISTAHVALRPGSNLRPLQRGNSMTVKHTQALEVLKYVPVVVWNTVDSVVKISGERNAI